MSILVKETPDKISAHLMMGIECGELVFQRIDSNVYALSIHIDEAYQKQGWSRRLFTELFKSVNLDPDALLVIDADASNGYWDYLGFVPNRYGYDYQGRRTFSIRGYEKISTVRSVKNKFLTPLFLKVALKKRVTNNMTDLTVNVKDFAAFYPGAGLDIAPIVLFPHITEWYYMDSQPVSEFGSTIFPGCERPRFIERLKNIMGQIGMDCMLHTDHFLLFIHPTTKCKVTYYVNAVFPKALEYCYLPCNVFVACGFDLKHRPPHFMGRWTHIITSDKTYNDDWMSEWKHAQVSTIVWDEVEDEFLDENRKVEFITKHSRIYRDVCEKAVCHSHF